MGSRIRAEIEGKHTKKKTGCHYTHMGVAVGMWGTLKRAASGHQQYGVMRQTHNYKLSTQIASYTKHSNRNNMTRTKPTEKNGKALKTWKKSK